MSKYTELVNSIAANPELHQVDKQQKMSDTIDVICANRDKLHRKALSISGRSSLDESRGYGLGHGRNTGD